MSSPIDYSKSLVDKLNKSRPLGAEDLWLIEQDLNQQLQAGAVAEPLSPDPLTNPLVNLDSTGGCGASRRSAGWLVWVQESAPSPLSLTPLPGPQTSSSPWRASRAVWPRPSLSSPSPTWTWAPLCTVT